MTARTPGEWRAVSGDGAERPHYIEAVDGAPAAVAEVSVMQGPEGWANACLLAAAPDMSMVLIGGPWLVWSIEHTAWWGPNHCGYTTRQERAGRYSLEQARAICRSVNYRAGSDHEGTGIPSEVMVPSPQWLMLSDAAIAKAEGR